MCFFFTAVILFWFSIVSDGDIFLSLKCTKISKNSGIDLIFVKFKMFLFIGPKNALLRLAVKFFPPDPGQLQEEYTR